MGDGNSQVKMNLDRMKIAMETCEATVTALETAAEDVRTTMTDLEYSYIGEDANTLQNEMKNYLDSQVENIRLNAESMKKALEQGLENARYCKNYCQHFVDALGGGANEATNDNEEIPGAMFCDYDVVEGLSVICTKAEELGEEIRQSTYKIENVLNLEVVSFNVTSYTSAVRSECDKIDRLGAHKRNLENYASYVETTDTELASSLRGIHDIFRDQEGAEIGNLEYGSIDAEIKKMQKMEKIREELIKQYGEDIVDEWGELTLIEMQKNMRSLPMKYTDEEMINILEMCQTKEDQAFIKLLLQGKYDEAFALAPNELSLEISYVLANYSAHLIRYDRKGRYEEGVKEFTDFCNAILATDDSICIEVDGVRTYVEEKHWERYLDMMMEGSVLQLKTEAISLSMMNPYEEDYDMSYYSSCFMTHAIWCTQSSIMDELRSKNGDIRCKIFDLKIKDNGIASFSISLDSLTYGQTTEKVSISLMEGGDDVRLNDDKLDLSKARKNQEKLIKDYIKSLCKGGITALAACVPEAAVTVSIMMMALEENVGSISGTEAFLDGNLQTVAFGFGNELASNTINTIINIEKASKNVNSENYKLLMQMAGSGAKYNMTAAVAVDYTSNNVAFTGIYNPDIIRAINYWNNKGAVGWSGWNENEINDIYLNIVGNNEKKEEKENAYKNKEIKYTYEEFLDQCERILKGGNIFSENEINMELFLDAIEAIKDETKVNLREEFIEWVKNEHGVVLNDLNAGQEVK